MYGLLTVADVDYIVCLIHKIWYINLLYLYDSISVPNRTYLCTLLTHTLPSPMYIRSAVLQQPASLACRGSVVGC